MKKIFILIAAPLFMIQYAAAQNAYTIEQCMELALQQTPIKQQKAYYATMETLEKRQVTLHHYPQLSINGQASYQSDVITFPSSPVFDGPDIPKDQYRISVDLNQTLYDGGLVKHKSAAEASQIAVQQASVEVTLHKVVETVHEIYYRILMLEQNEAILNEKLELLRTQEKVVAARVRNGVMLPSDQKQFTKQKLNTEQSLLELSYDINALREVLGTWTGQDMQNADLRSGNYTISQQPAAFKRPELDLYRSQERLYQSMSSVAGVQRRPKLSLFASGGYGSPNPYNIFETDFNTFYIVGLRINWKILDYGAYKMQKDVNELQQQIVSTQREQFEDNLSRELIQEKALQEKLAAMIQNDETLLSLQKEIVASSFSQLQNGAITSVEYLDEVNEQSTLAIQKSLHETQLQKSALRWQIINGNILNAINTNQYE
jgi:outer membrane protein TolC